MANRHNPRESYRNYTPKKYPYFLLILLDVFLTLFTVAFLLLQLSVPALVIFSFCRWSSLLTKTAIYFTSVVLMLSKLLRVPMKRFVFILKLKRTCKKEQYTVKSKNTFAKTLFSFSNKVDVIVETDTKTYEMMFIPSIRRTTRLIFEKRGEVKIVTGFTRSRIKDALGLKKREKDFCTRESIR